MIVRCQEKGWMDNTVVWGEIGVWASSLIYLKNENSGMDSFHAQMTDDVKQRLWEAKNTIV